LQEFQAELFVGHEPPDQPFDDSLRHREPLSRGPQGKFRTAVLMQR
jgi:hypothetical protein